MRFYPLFFENTKSRWKIFVREKGTPLYTSYHIEKKKVLIFPHRKFGPTKVGLPDENLCSKSFPTESYWGHFLANFSSGLGKSPTGSVCDTGIL